MYEELLRRIKLDDLEKLNQEQGNNPPPQLFPEENKQKEEEAVKIRFRVIDNWTGQEANLESIIFNEYSCRLLRPNDGVEWAITQEGKLIIRDFYGNYGWIEQQDRFTVKMVVS